MIGSGTSATQKFHVQLRRKPKFRVRRFSLNVRTCVLFAAKSFTSDGRVLMTCLLAGISHISEPVSIRKIIPEFRSLIWRRLEFLTPDAMVLKPEGHQHLIKQEFREALPVIDPERWS